MHAASALSNVRVDALAAPSRANLAASCSGRAHAASPPSRPPTGGIVFSIPRRDCRGKARGRVLSRAAGPVDPAVPSTQDEIDAIWSASSPAYLQHSGPSVDEDDDDDDASFRSDVAATAVAAAAKASESSRRAPIRGAPSGAGVTTLAIDEAAMKKAAQVPVVSPDGYEWGPDGLHKGDPVWDIITLLAKKDAAAEPLLSSYMYMSVLSHETLEQALSFVLANRLADSTLLPTQLMEIFNSVLFAADVDGVFVRDAIRKDIKAIYQRDPACFSYVHALLYLKGFHALQAHRIQHALWKRGQRLLALTMQARISTVFAMDLHPAARLGKGILIDHGTGVVIGETAVVGDNVSILQGVTLGGTGKDVGDRHPKIGKGVLIGAHSTILGNITVGKGAMIAAGSLVLKPVAPHTMVAGAPARAVGQARAPAPAIEMSQEISQPVKVGAERGGGPTERFLSFRGDLSNRDLEEAMRVEAERKEREKDERLSIWDAEECLDSSVKDLEECVEARAEGAKKGKKMRTMQADMEDLPDDVDWYI